MEPILYLFGGVANFVAALGGALAAIFIGWAGIQWMMASGDPQKMGQARMSVIGTIVGLVLVGGSFIIPDAINERILRPAGTNLETSGPGLDCDRSLKNTLVRNRWASSPDRMMIVVRGIQARVPECNPNLWDPDIPELAAGAGCSSVGVTRIGSSDVPKGLEKPGSNEVRAWSGRDDDNNILVKFSSSKRPADSASCWLYVSRLKIWDQTY